MRELSLFSGAGGGLLATKHLLGWTTIGYVEYEPYCQKILKQRIKDGYLDPAPIFGDIRQFISEGYAEAYQGMVDVLTAGFPCQPFSVAGKQKGADDERNMWPATRDTIRIVRPRYIFLENVPNLLTHEYAWTITSDLTAAGYSFCWSPLSASDLGGPCESERAFIVAQADSLDGKAWMGTLKNWTGQVQLGFNKQVFREMWLQTIERNAGSYNGVANYLDRGRAIGNGQIPRMVELAWRVLNK